jgi:hypothetical protein
MGLEIWFKDDLLQLLDGLMQARELQQPHDAIERAKRDGYRLALQAVAASIGGSLLVAENTQEEGGKWMRSL